MTTRLLRNAALAAIVAMGAASCTARTASTAPTGQINLNNGTTVPIFVVVNGTVVATVPANTTEAPIPGVLPARPWTIDARSSSGSVLATLTVAPDDQVSQQSSKGDVEFLTCGELTLWVGGPMPDAPRPSGSPRPCA